MKFIKSVSNITNLVFGIVFTLLFIYPLTLGDPQIRACYEDDFYYYLKTAINFIELGFPTFDGEIATNGYHPLWFLIITGFVAAFGKGKLFFVAMNIFVLLLNVASLVLLRKLLSLVLDNKYYIELIVVICIYKLVNVSITGMEVVATVPIILYLMYYFQKNYDKLNYFILALLLSLMILSRLDTMLLSLFFIILLIKQKKIDSKGLLPFALGLLPVALYILSNKIFFDTLLPVSGMAKQIRYSYYPSFEALKLMFLGNINAIFLHLLPTLLVPILLFKKDVFSKIKLKQELVLSLTLFTLVYFPLLSIISGWRFFNWYFYPFIFLLMILLVLLDSIPTFKSFASKFQRIIYSLALIYVSVWTVNFKFVRSYDGFPFYAEIEELAKFVNAHPGKYSMGDRAGLLGYLSNSPIFQLEGLVEDKAYLENIKNTVSLREVFAKYKIDYYISYNLEIDKKSGKYLAIEPIEGYEFGNRFMTTPLDYKLELKFKKKDTYYVYNLNKAIN